jgi:hypothetical protein
MTHDETLVAEATINTPPTDGGLKLLCTVDLRNAFNLPKPIVGRWNGQEWEVPEIARVVENSYPVDSIPTSFGKAVAIEAWAEIEAPHVTTGITTSPYILSLLWIEGSNGLEPRVGTWSGEIWRVVTLCPQMRGTAFVDAAIAHGKKVMSAVPIAKPKYRQDKINVKNGMPCWVGQHQA